ncbi:MAG: transposase [Phycisphaerae bacterium]|nr:transposase [Phycisphaerae bacterium]
MLFKSIIPDSLVYRPRWKIGIEQIERVMAQGLRLEWVTFDEEYGKVPEFWFSLDHLGKLWETMDSHNPVRHLICIVLVS